jgi:hypothetical protein
MAPTPRPVLLAAALGTAVLVVLKAKVLVVLVVLVALVALVVLENACRCAPQAAGPQEP